jgi:hypothetical protein
MTAFGHLRGEAVPVINLNAPQIEAMYDLFSQHYELTCKTTFTRDLQSKRHVVLVWDASGRVRGFSTLAVKDHPAQGTISRIFFSGDTIVDPACWGSPVLQSAWLRLVGHLLRDTKMPAYWLLTTKGHRTFRLLPLWFKTFYPSLQARDEQDGLRNLATTLGLSRYGDRYDPATNIIHMSGCADRLNPALAAVPAKDARRSDVQFFLDRNPGFADGDELLCLAALHADNMTRFSRRAFLAGQGRTHDKHI